MTTPPISPSKCKNRRSIRPAATPSPITGPNGEKYYIDRRSYLAKSVPQRMAIISAGVIMNVIFAFIFATIAYGMGVSYLPCIISEAVPGSPAWEAGLEPGDEIIQLGNQVNPTFTELRGDVTLGDRDAGIRCIVRRAADEQEIERVLKPKEGGGLAKIGVAPPLTVTLLPEMAARPGTAAAESKFIGLTGNASNLEVLAGNIDFQGGGRIVRVGEAAITNYRELVAELARQPDAPLFVTIERTLATSAATDDENAPRPETTLEATFEVPVQRAAHFRPDYENGAIAGIQSGSPAADAGLKTGDQIETVDGKSSADDSPTSEGWNPEELPEYFRIAAKEGRLSSCRSVAPLIVVRRSRNSRRLHLASSRGSPPYFIRSCRSMLHWPCRPPVLPMTSIAPCTPCSLRVRRPRPESVQATR